MQDNAITIGRDPNSDIRIDERWDTASNNHADIKLENGELFYYDHSSNGTTINGKLIHHTHIRLQSGDEIVVGGFKVEWSKITPFFPQLRRRTVIHDNTDPKESTVGQKEEGRKTNLFNDHAESNQSEQRKTQPLSSGRTGTEDRKVINRPPQELTSSMNMSERDKYLAKWNWGAFLSGWLWAVCHNLWWAFAVLGALFVPYLGIVAAIGLSTWLGIDGSNIAWRSGKYGNDWDKFHIAQRRWVGIGIVISVINLAIIIAANYYGLSVIKF